MNVQTISFVNKNKAYQDAVQTNWQRLEKWIEARHAKIILIFEGEANKTTERAIKLLKLWSDHAERIRWVDLKQIKSFTREFYFHPFLSHLPQPGQVTIFENCWLGTEQFGEHQTEFWQQFAETEEVLQQSNFFILKYAFAKSNEGSTTLLDQLDQTNTNNWFHIDYHEDKLEAYSLLEHLISQIPHQDLTFPHDNIDIPLLKKRAYNLRWATVEEGVIPLTAADPDFPIAPEIREAIHRYTRGGVFSYGAAEGLPEFREAAAEVLQTRKGINCQPNWILPTDGAASGMYTIARALLEPGDEAIVFDPVDFLFKASVDAAGATAVRVAFHEDSGSFHPAELEAAITERTKMICLCNPHNPMGRVLTREELMFIGSLAVKHNLWIMNDEIWSDIVFAPHRHINIASLHPEIAKRTISVYGFSKTFGLAGLRVGFVAPPSEKLFQHLLQTSKANTTAGGVSTLSQVAATAAYKEGWYWADAFIDHLTKVRDYSHQRLVNMPGVRCRKPEGTYLLFPNIEAFGMTSEDFVKVLLQNAKVAVVPGAAKWFGEGAEGHIRLCFSTSMEMMTEALDRIENCLQTLPLQEMKSKKQIISQP
ncbi:MAG: pyridoxal phosphate-dependent aminotransferase [Bacteroidota bacterium]